MSTGDLATAWLKLSCIPADQATSLAQHAGFISDYTPGRGKIVPRK